MVTEVNGPPKQEVEDELASIKTELVRLGVDEENVPLAYTSLAVAARWISQNIPYQSKALRRRVRIFVALLIAVRVLRKTHPQRAESLLKRYDQLRKELPKRGVSVDQLMEKVRESHSA